MISQIGITRVLRTLFMFDIPLLTWLTVSCTTLNGIKYISISFLYITAFPKTKLQHQFYHKYVPMVLRLEEENERNHIKVRWPK